MALRHIRKSRLPSRSPAYLLDSHTPSSSEQINGKDHSNKSRTEASRQSFKDWTASDRRASAPASTRVSTIQPLNLTDEPAQQLSADRISGPQANGLDVEDLGVNRCRQADSIQRRPSSHLMLEDGDEEGRPAPFTMIAAEDDPLNDSGEGFSHQQQDMASGANPLPCSALREVDNRRRLEMGADVNQFYGRQNPYLNLPASLLQTPTNHELPPCASPKLADAAYELAGMLGTEKFVLYKRTPRGPESTAHAIFQRMKERVPERSAASPRTDEGYLYVFKIDDHPGYVKIGLTTRKVQNRLKEVEKNFPGRLTVADTDSYCLVKHLNRLETIIKDDLHDEQRFQKGLDKSGKESLLGELFEIDEQRAVAIVRKWRDWIRSNPYDGNGRLSKHWANKIQIFETRFDILLEGFATVKRWDPLLNSLNMPSLRFRLHCWAKQTRRSRFDKSMVKGEMDVLCRLMLLIVLWALLGFWRVAALSHVFAFFAFV
ncbi:uncharacterized protein KY384_008357 [Bacidia gigantensis]|uniref:uncharacterized protein n=1 Tax=Bacidia gigantensis TaxID=2732470 RepID=UPI001D03BD87|nr:uncharacterized protein KY384_008357 [Bacidia gigantensis]KAG8526928.1 hypothetical protein KY384_008357 [Bacidia gigantensis]